MKAFDELERGVYAALETYSNVHRGSGHNSMVSTHLFEHAREIVLEYMGFKKGKFVVIFCTLRGAKTLGAQLEPASYKCLSGKDFGLSLGVRALVVRKKALPSGVPFQTGGGTARLVSPGWVVWSKAPEKFEAGTPAIINIIAFAKALRLIRQFGMDVFRDTSFEKLTVEEILYHDELEEYSGRELLDELRKTIIGRNVLVPTAEGPVPYVNLDNGASTPAFTPVWNAVIKTWRQTGQIHQEIIHEVRSICSKALGAPLSDYDLIFTSNTTEAINITAESLSGRPESGIEPVVLNTLLEHTSNELPWRLAQGFSLIRLPVDREGFVDLLELESILSEYNNNRQHGNKRIRLVAITGASNVLGVCNDLAEISLIAHRYGANLLVDAAQLVAHRGIDMKSCGIDYLAFSAHKVYAPFGSGVLVARKGLLSFGTSGLELIQSSGEENVGGIAALGKSLLLMQRIGFNVIRDEEQALTRRALNGMAQIPGLTVFGIKDPDSSAFTRKGGVIVFNIKGKMANQAARLLAELGGIGVRYGCHCAHLLVKHLLNVPPWLERFQRLIANLFKRVNFPGVVRVSLGIGNSKEDVDRLIHVLGKISQKSPDKADIKKEMGDFVRHASMRVYDSDPTTA
jgi:selenocysteine lyase/cysteine desulfurase